MVDFKHNGTRNRKYFADKGIFPALFKCFPTPHTHKAGLNYKNQHTRVEQGSQWIEI